MAATVAGAAAIKRPRPAALIGGSDRGVGSAARFVTGVRRAVRGWRMAQVAFDRVSKIYPDGTRAVNEIDLEIDGRRVHGARRPSGCGKTTALRMVAGLEEISEGALRIGDRVVNHVPSRDRDIAMVFQSYALYPHLSGLREHRVRPAAARSCRRTRSTSACRARPRILGLERAPEAQAARALRRAAPARRDGPRDRARAGGVPDGRAALEPRREAARADARRDREACSATSA